MWRCQGCDKTIEKQCVFNARVNDYPNLEDLSGCDVDPDCLVEVARKVMES